MDSIITIAISGAVGGLVKSLVEQKGAVALPRIERCVDGTKYIHLGGISNLIIGSVIAFLTANTAITAILAGISSAFIAEKILERTNTVGTDILKPS